MLYEEVNERDEGYEEAACEIFPQGNGARVGRAQGDAANCPGERGNEVGDHEDVMPVVVVGRGDVGPSTTCQRSEEAHPGNKGRQPVARPPRQ